MTRLSLFGLVLLGALVWAGPAVAADGILVAPASGRRVSAAIVSRARAALLYEVWARCPSCRLIDHQGPPRTNPLDEIGAAMLAAAENDVDLVLALDLDHTRSQTQFTLVAFRPAPPGQAAARPQILSEATSENPDVVRALVHQLVARLYQPYPDPPSIVATPDPPRRVFFGIAAGLALQFGTAGGLTAVLPGFDLSVAYYGMNSLVDIRADIAGASDGDRYTIGASYSYRPSDRLSLGVAANWVSMKLGGRGATGPAIGPIIGFLISGTKAPLVRLEGGYSFNLFQEQEMDRLIPGSDRAHWSHGPQLLLGVLL